VCVVRSASRSPPPPETALTRTSISMLFWEANSSRRALRMAADSVSALGSNSGGSQRINFPGGGAGVGVCSATGSVAPSVTLVGTGMSVCSGVTVAFCCQGISQLSGSNSHPVSPNRLLTISTTNKILIFFTLSAIYAIVKHLAREVIPGLLACRAAQPIV
jgi:hypothetical protein